MALEARALGEQPVVARLVFLLEEPSMRYCLEGLLPRLAPDLEYVLVPHEGKQDLEKSIPTKLRGWKYPEDQFVIVRDQDSGDCVTIKEDLVHLCQEVGKEPALVRIACRELESWFLGDLAAVEQATKTKNLAKLQGKQSYRDPDRLGSPSQELKRLVSGYSKTRGARDIGKVLSLEGNTSKSYRVFVSGIRRVVDQLPQ